MQRLNSTLGCYPHLTLHKINILTQRALSSGCTMHHNGKRFQLKAAVSLLKSTYEQSCALYRLETTAIWNFKLVVCFFDGEHNVKSKPQIVYALWLPTILWLCPGATQLHQTGETNRISCKQSVCSCGVVENVLGCRSWRFCVHVCVCVKWKVTNDSWCSLVFLDSNIGRLHL